MRDEFIRFRNYKNRVALYGFASGVLAFIGTMVDKGRWLGNFIKSVVLGYCMCTLCTVTVENSIVLPLRTKIAVQTKRDWALCVCFDCWFEVFQYLSQIMTYFEPCFQ